MLINLLYLFVIILNFQSIEQNISLTKQSLKIRSFHRIYTIKETNKAKPDNSGDKLGNSTLLAQENAVDSVNSVNAAQQGDVKGDNNLKVEKQKQEKSKVNENEQGENQVENEVLLDVKECDERIHRKCVQVKYTEEEVEKVRLYLAERFRETNPLKPICKQIYVRKDIKCLNQYELSQLIHGFKELYRKGIIDRYSLIHAYYWPATHKFAEGIVWHRWHVRQMEKELQRVNPKLSMPYWESYSEFAAPERSSIWNFLGTAGDRSNYFCIPDGAFAYTLARYPFTHCITRQWNSDGSITPWEAPEWLTSVTQVARNWSHYVNLIGFTGHFKLHLSIGGYYGDYSIPWATNDPLFYIFHGFPTDLALLKWQLSDDEFLVPNSYSGNNRLLIHLNRIVVSDIESDTLSYYNNIRVKEAFQVGFGELCYIHDQLIRPINNIVDKIERVHPIAVKILKESLPKISFRKYFPKFADKTDTAFDHFFPDIGHCSSAKNECKPIPVALPYNTTANGIRQLERFRIDGGLDVTPLTFQAETLYYNFMYELRENKYCSPYVT